MYTDKSDGCLAWGVALAACLINFVMAGLGRMSGILYVAFIEMFGISRGLATAPFSIRSSTRNILGPVVGILGQQYGVRTVSVIGGVVGAISAASCYFAPDINWIIIIWGGLNGVGTAFTTTLPQVVIGQYFKKHHTTASGLAFSGGCVGSFLFPALIEYLLHHYGLEDTFLVISGLIMHVIPAAMLLRKPPWIKASAMKRTDDPPNTLIENYDTLSVSCQNENAKCSDGKNFCKNNSNKENVSNCNKFVSEEDVYIDTLFETAKYLSSLEYFGSVSCKNIVPSKVAIYNFLNHLPEFNDKCDITSDINSSNVKYRNSSEVITYNDEAEIIISTLNELKKEEVLQQVVAYLKTTNFIWLGSYTPENLEDVLKQLVEWCRLYKELNKHDNGNGKTNIDVPTSHKRSESLNHKHGFKENIKRSFKLNKNPIFHLICLSRTIHFVTFIPVVTVIVDYGMDKGFAEEDGKYIIAALSAGDLIGRLGLGWITDRGILKLPRYMLIFMILQGIVTVSLPFINILWLFLVIIAIFGMFQGSLFIRHPVLVTRYMNHDEQPIAMGCINFLSGLIGFGIPAYIGHFRDHLGSYDQMFYITGVAGTCVGLLWTLESKFNRCMRRANANIQNS